MIDDRLAQPICPIYIIFFVSRCAHRCDGCLLNCTQRSDANKSAVRKELPCRELFRTLVLPLRYARTFVSIRAYIARCIRNSVHGNLLRPLVPFCSTISDGRRVTAEKSHAIFPASFPPQSTYPENRSPKVVSRAFEMGAKGGRRCSMFKWKHLIFQLSSSKPASRRAPHCPSSDTQQFIERGASNYRSLFIISVEIEAR